jgi:hypothetical protein
VVYVGRVRTGWSRRDAVDIRRVLTSVEPAEPIKGAETV